MITFICVLMLSLSCKKSKEPPQFITQPQNVTVIAGGNATFTVAATGDPIPTFQWQSSPNGTTWTDISGATSTTLTLNAVTVAMSGNQYRCVASNSAGTVNSATATLTVNPADTPPQFTTQPANVTVTAGNNAAFTVTVTGNPTPTLQWQSSPDGTTWTNIGSAISGVTNSTLNLSAVTTAMSGNQYRCVATNSAGTVNSATATLTVNTAGTPPQFTTQPANKSVNSGGTATFTVVVKGSPAPTLQWQSLSNGGATWTNISGATSTTLTLNAVTVAMSGTLYRCVATNAVEIVSSDPAMLIVDGIAVFLPPLTYTPTKDDTSTDPGSGVWNAPNRAQNHWIILKPIQDLFINEYYGAFVGISIPTIIDNATDAAVSLTNFVSHNVNGMTPGYRFAQSVDNGGTPNLPLESTPGNIETYNFFAFSQLAASNAYAKQGSYTFKFEVTYFNGAVNKTFIAACQVTINKPNTDGILAKYKHRTEMYKWNGSEVIIYGNQGVAMNWGNLKQDLNELYWDVEANTVPSLIFKPTNTGSGTYPAYPAVLGSDKVFTFTDESSMLVGYKKSNSASTVALFDPNATGTGSANWTNGWQYSVGINLFGNPNNFVELENIKVFSHSSIVDGEIVRNGGKTLADPINLYMAGYKSGSTALDTVAIYKHFDFLNQSKIRVDIDGVAPGSSPANNPIVPVTTQADLDAVPVSVAKLDAAQYKKAGTYFIAQGPAAAAVKFIINTTAATAHFNRYYITFDASLLTGSVQDGTIIDIDVYIVDAYAASVNTAYPGANLAFKQTFKITLKAGFRN